MTGTVQGVIASLGGDFHIIPWALSGVAGTGTGSGCTASVTLNSNGTQTFSVVPLGTNSCVGSANWYTPTTAGAGNVFWARLVSLTGVPMNSGTPPGTIVQLNAARTWGIAIGTPGSTGAGTSKLQIARDVGMNLIVAERTFSHFANG